MENELTIVESGESESLLANRECHLLVHSNDWSGETAELQQSDNGTDWQQVIVLNDNYTMKAESGFNYRLNKSGGVASVRFALIFR